MRSDEEPYGGVFLGGMEEGGGDIGGVHAHALE